MRITYRHRTTTEISRVGLCDFSHCLPFLDAFLNGSYIRVSLTSLISIPTKIFLYNIYTLSDTLISCSVMFVVILVVLIPYMLP